MLFIFSFFHLLFFHLLYFHLFIFSFTIYLFSIYLFCFISLKLMVHHCWSNTSCRFCICSFVYCSLHIGSDPHYLHSEINFFLQLLKGRGFTRSVVNNALSKFLKLNLSSKFIQNGSQRITNQITRNGGFSFC